MLLRGFNKIKKTFTNILVEKNSNSNGYYILSYYINRFCSS